MPADGGRGGGQPWKKIVAREGLSPPPVRHPGREPREPADRPADRVSRPRLEHPGQPAITRSAYGRHGGCGQRVRCRAAGPAPDRTWRRPDDGDGQWLSVCNLAGDLENAVMRVFSRRAAGEVPYFARLMIEPSGLADPAPIAQATLRNPVMSCVLRLHAIVRTVDAAAHQALWWTRRRWSRSGRRCDGTTPSQWRRRYRPRSRRLARPGETPPAKGRPASGWRCGR